MQLRSISRTCLVALVVVAVAVAGVATGSFSFVEDPGNPELVFSSEQVERFNWASENSVDHQPVADERLFCFDVDGQVGDLACWTVSENEEGYELEPVEVGIQ